MNNAFTVDVEDYFQVEALKQAVDLDKWDDYPCRVEANTHRVLQILDESQQKGTFFVLGWIAKRYPQLVKQIAANGHEVASHGMSHQLIYNQSAQIFEQETRESKAILEDLVQRPIEGYRAATYSITKKSLWALDILVDAGFRYDSSVFPMRHDKYGIADINPLPHKMKTPNGQEIIEFPISTLKRRGFTLPIAGGGYFRLFPYWMTRWGLNQVNRNGQPFVFYIHPWEIDPEQPRVEGISLLSKFRHYNNLEICESRLIQLSRDFSLTTMKNVLNDLELID